MFQINSSSLAGKLKSKYGCQNLTINKRGLFQIHGIPYSILFCWRMICSITGLIWSLSQRAIICGIKLLDQMQSCTWSQTANHVLKEVWGNENLKLVKETYETCPSFIVFEHGNLCVTLWVTRYWQTFQWQSLPSATISHSTIGNSAQNVTLQSLDELRMINLVFTQSRDWLYSLMPLPPCHLQFLHTVWEISQKCASDL